MKQQNAGSRVTIVHIGKSTGGLKGEKDLSGVKFVPLTVLKTAVIQVIRITERQALCPKGYSNFKGRCRDNNECAGKASPCKKGALCVNTPGSYVCFCSRHLRYDRRVGCTNKKPCLVKPCPSGFFMNKKNKCVDINECKGSNPCRDETAKCTNLPGTFKVLRLLPPPPHFCILPRPF